MYFGNKKNLSVQFKREIDEYKMTIQKMISKADTLDKKIVTIFDAIESLLKNGLNSQSAEQATEFLIGVSDFFLLSKHYLRQSLHPEKFSFRIKNLVNRTEHAIALLNKKFESI